MCVGGGALKQSFLVLDFSANLRGLPCLQKNLLIFHLTPIHGFKYPQVMTELVIRYVSGCEICVFVKLIAHLPASIFLHIKIVRHFQLVEIICGMGGTT